jgi:galacturan 1,4-alpha-galacturonidase
MLKFPVLFLLLATLTSALLSISDVAAYIDTKKLERRSNCPKRSTCIPAASGNSSIDDVPALKAAFASCGAGGLILIPLGSKYYINSQLTFAGCVNCEFQIEGTLQISDNLTYWNGRGSAIYVYNIAGIKISSTTGKGLIDGNGQASWERFAVDSSYSRPVLVRFYGCTNTIFTNMKIINAPSFFVTATGNTKHADFSYLTLSAISNSSTPPKNTDGIDIGPASYVTVSDVTITNNDDCVVFKPGANFVEVYRVTCYGSHGLSVGSLGNGIGSNDTVMNVYVKDALMVNSTKAAGIKLYPSGPLHGSATVVNVTWDSIVCKGCEYAAQVQGCYNAPNATYCQQYPSTAILNDIRFVNFTGITSGKYKNVVANLNCPANKICDVLLPDFAVTSPTGPAVELCANLPVSPGINCTSGASG